MRRTRTMQFCRAAGAFFLVLAASAAQAWNYSEHVSITNSAFQKACAEDSPRESSPDGRSNVAAALCKSKRAQLCFAHMVAVAGDHSSRPDQLWPEKARGIEHLYLAAEVGLPDPSEIDCRSIVMAMQKADSQRDNERLWDPETKLVAGTLAKRLEYGRLASRNIDHFQPEALQQWLKYIQRARDAARDGDEPQRLQRVLAEAAFAMHFLEDAFAAGHSGLKRELREQEYAQTYHDDFNRTGRFFLQADDEWHSYGDGKLKSGSHYLPLEQFKGEGWEDNVRRFLSCQGEDKRGEKKVLDLFRTAIDSHEPEVNVLSLATDGRADDFFCQFTDTCDKREFILSRRTDADFDKHKKKQGCDRTTTCAVEWTCKDSETRVVNSAAENLKAVLAYLAGSAALPVESKLPEKCAIRGTLIQGLDDASLSDRRMWIVLCSLPVEYRTIENAGGQWGLGGINASSGLLRYGDRHDGAKPESTRFFNAWTFAADRKLVSSNDNMAPALLLGVQLADPERDGRYAWFIPSVRSGILWEVIDTHGKILNAFSASAYVTPWSGLFGGVLNVSGKVSLGVDNIWQGGHNRYYYIAPGVSLDVHVGKHTFFVELETRNHSSRDAGGKSFSRLLIGYRGSSIALLQQ